MLSKIFATVISYPYQIIRARLQNQTTTHETKKMNLDPHSSNRVIYKGVIGTVKTVFQREGISGFYRGLFINVLRVLPGTCVTFVVYEGVVKVLREKVE